MEQRQLRLGDVVDDYCPRERRITNHAIVAMVGAEVKQTRCTTCEAEHEFKHAVVPRQRRKPDSPAALFAQVAAGAPKRVAQHDPKGSPRDRDADADGDESSDDVTIGFEPARHEPVAAARRESPTPMTPLKPQDADEGAPDEGESPSSDGARDDEGPIHRRLIRASLPRLEGQPPPTRPLPEFTIRQPAGRQNRFGARPNRGAVSSFPGNRSGGNTGGGQRQGGSRPGQPHQSRRHGQGQGSGQAHKRSK